MQIALKLSRLNGLSVPKPVIAMAPSTMERPVHDVKLTFPLLGDVEGFIIVIGTYIPFDLYQSWARTFIRPN